MNLDAQGYAIVKVNEVLAAENQSVELSKLAQGQYEQLYAQAEAAAYYEALKNKFKVQFKVARP